MSEPPTQSYETHTRRLPPAYLGSALALALAALLTTAHLVFRPSFAGGVLLLLALGAGGALWQLRVAALRVQDRVIRLEERLRLERLLSAEASVPLEVWSDATAARVLALLTALPHGVLRMSDDIPGLVETSTSLARVRTEGATLRVAISNRSSVASALAAAQARTAAFAELVGGEFEVQEGYPGWKPNLDSKLLALLKRVHERELGTAPAIQAIHAGLECGVLGEKLPGAEMISFGPQIESPHSPAERVLVPSVERFWRLLRATLAELAA